MNFVLKGFLASKNCRKRLIENWFILVFKLLLPISLITFTGCPSGHSGQPKTTNQSFYVREDKQNKKVIVFVHGVLGDSRSTWTNPQTNAFWPELLTKDSTFDGWNIFVYGFPSPALEKSYSIDEISEDFRLILDSNDISQHDEIIFLVHSMGGLVTRAYLNKYRDIADKVKFICFYSTPTTGSEVARWGKLASDNPQLKQMVTLTSDSFLADQLRQWLAAGHNKIPSYCAYEILDTYGEKIVDMASGVTLSNRRLDPVNANHINIVKPENENDKPYLIFKSAFKETLLNPRKDTPSLQGIVVDQNDRPIQGAQVTIDVKVGMTPVETSSDGVFIIPDISKKYGEGVRIRVIKAGYRPNPYTEDVILGAAPPRISLRRIR